MNQEVLLYSNRFEDLLREVDPVTHFFEQEDLINSGTLTRAVILTLHSGKPTAISLCGETNSFCGETKEKGINKLLDFVERVSSGVVKVTFRYSPFQKSGHFQESGHWLLVLYSNE